MSQPKDRDVRISKDRPPADGAPLEPWHEEPTGVHTDVQVFRAVKALGEELQKSKTEAAKAHGALKQEVAQFKTAVDGRLTKQDLVLERMAGQLDVLVPMARKRPPSAESKAIEVTKTRITTNGKIIIAIATAAIATIGTVLVAVLS